MPQTHEAVRAASACLCVLAVLVRLTDLVAMFLHPWDSVNQADSQGICQQHGGNLVTIGDPTDNQRLVTELLPYLPAKGDLWLWIGLVAPDSARSSDKNSWYWLSRGPPAEGYNGPGYANWAKPKNNGSLIEPRANRSCSQLVAKTGTWISYYCDDDTAGYVCQAGKVAGQRLQDAATRPEGAANAGHPSMRVVGDACGQ